MNVGNWFHAGYAKFIAAARWCLPDILQNLQLGGGQNDPHQGEG